MDRETARYIINHFPNLLTDKERIARRHSMSLLKLGEFPSEAKIQAYRDREWLTDDNDALTLLKKGYEEFELNVANRILNETSEKVFLNKCPKCGQLARTPYARQCRFCEHNWHDLNVAKFKFKSSFQLTGRHFFILGEITNGEIKIGNFIDLTMLGLNCKSKIEAIEYALRRADGVVWEDIGLGTNELSEEEKKYLIQMGSFGTPLDIINKR